MSDENVSRNTQPVIGGDPNNPARKAPLRGKGLDGPINKSLSVMDQMIKDDEAADAQDMSRDEAANRVAAAVETVELTPEEKARRYAEGLESVGFSLDDARRIQEEILVNQYYEEDIKFGPITVRLRTKLGRDTIRVHRTLEAEKPEIPAVAQAIINRYSTAAALAQYGTKVFKHPPPDASDVDHEESFHERLRYLDCMSDISSNKLMQAAYKFDQKLSKVFADGAPEDF